jgi:RNA recognition motif-containing protein
MKDKFNGISKGSGFIEMLRDSDGFTAVRNLNGKVLKEGAIVVNTSRSWSNFGNNSRRSNGRGTLKR